MSKIFLVHVYNYEMDERPQTCKVLPEEQTVLDLKREICDFWHGRNFQEEFIQMTFNGKPLKDDQTLSESGITEEYSKIEYVYRDPSKITALQGLLDAEKKLDEKLNREVEKTGVSLSDWKALENAITTSNQQGKNGTVIIAVLSFLLGLIFYHQFLL